MKEYKLLTVKQASEYLQVSAKTIYRMIKAGDLPASKICNSRWQIKEKDLEQHLGLCSSAQDKVSSGYQKELNLDFEPKPTLISLFSGGGGLDLGFKQAGFHILFANDCDKYAQTVYRHNLGEIDERSITEIDTNEIPDGDILTAGFPCQPFSSAGLRQGVNDKRGLLYQECLRVIKEKRPKVIVFENVKGLLSSKYFDGRKLVDVIIDDLNNIGEIGYSISYKLLNAANYGVPQNRQRVFFVGVRKDLNINFEFPPEVPQSNLTLKHILNISANVPNQVDWPLSPQAKNMIQFIPEGGSWKNVPYENLAPKFKKIRDNMKKYHSPNFYRRFALDEICGTITASAQPENCGIIHPKINRRFNVREIARIQTFPDDFVFFTDNNKSTTEMYKVIGNAVPVKLAFYIAQAIMQQVFTNNLNHHENS